MQHEAGRELQPRGYVRFNWTMAGVVVGLLAQSAGLIVWGSKLDERVATLEQKLTTSEKLGETVARMDERTLALVSTVDRIDRRLSDQERGK